MIECVDDLHLRALLTAEGWFPVRVSMYDEEGIEGWRWDAPDGHPLDSSMGGEFYEMGEWDAPPAIPEPVLAYVAAMGEREARDG